MHNGGPGNYKVQCRQYSVCIVCVGTYWCEWLWLQMTMKKFKSAKKVIFPGVGEASSAMRYLKVTMLDD